MQITLIQSQCHYRNNTDLGEPARNDASLMKSALSALLHEIQCRLNLNMEESFICWGRGVVFHAESKYNQLK